MGYVHFTDMLLFVLGQVLWVNGRERSYRLRSYEHVVVLRVRHCLTHRKSALPPVYGLFTLRYFSVTSSSTSTVFTGVM